MPRYSVLHFRPIRLHRNRFLVENNSLNFCFIFYVKAIQLTFKESNNNNNLCEGSKYLLTHTVYVSKAAFTHWILLIKSQIKS